MKQLLLRGPASEDDRVLRVDRRVHGPAILASTQSGSIPRVTSVPARRRSCDGTLMSGHGDSAMDSASHATYERPHHGGIRFQRLIAEFRFRLFQRPRLAPGNVRSRICFGFFAPDIWRPDPGQRCRPQVARVVDQPSPASLNAAPCLRECRGFPGWLLRSVFGDPCLHASGRRA